MDDMTLNLVVLLVVVLGLGALCLEVLVHEFRPRLTRSRARYR